MNFKIDNVNVDELNSKSPSILINFFHVLSIIYSKTTRQHTPEFILYKTREFLKEALYWINSMYTVNDELESSIRNNVNENVKLFQEGTETPDRLIEFTSNSLILGDPKMQLDIIDYIIILLSLVSYKYGYTLDQVLDF